jgi:hypothetical protein
VNDNIKVEVGGRSYSGTRAEMQSLLNQFKAARGPDAKHYHEVASRIEGEINYKDSPPKVFTTVKSATTENVAVAIPASLPEAKKKGKK